MALAGRLGLPTPKIRVAESMLLVGIAGGCIEANGRDVDIRGDEG